MTQHSPENIRGRLQDISLTASEKAALKSTLEAFVKDHPFLVIRTAELARPSEYGTRSPLQLVSLRAFSRVAYAAILIAVLVGGGLSVAAENSLPGDVLYGVKVNVNEEVRAAAAVSNEAQASWDARRAQRRLEETERLAAEGRLDAKTSAQLETRFEKHAQDVTKQVNASGDAAVKAAVHSDLEATLEAHDMILRALIDANHELDGELGAVQTSVVAHAQAAQQARIEAENEFSGSTGTAVAAVANDRKEDVEKKIESIEEVVASFEGSVDVDISARLSEKLGASADAYATGETLTQTGEYGRAFAAFQQSLRTATEAEVLLSGSAVLESEALEKENDEKDGDDTSTTDSEEESEPTTEINLNSEESLTEDGKSDLDVNEDISFLQETTSEIRL